MCVCVAGRCRGRNKSWLLGLNLIQEMCLDSLWVAESVGEQGSMAGASRWYSSRRGAVWVCLGVGGGMGGNLASGVGHPLLMHIVPIHQ